MSLWDSVLALPAPQQIAFFVALFVAFGFEFINGFHDTANAVTTVIYTRSLPATPAVFYSGILNFLGVLVGGTTVAFGIVNLLPVDLLVDARSHTALVMVLSLLLAGVTWNLGTWYFGLPVSSSHTLIGSILGVGIANGIWSGHGLDGLNAKEVVKVFLALLFSPLFGFILSAGLLLLMRLIVRQPRLYAPPVEGDRPPTWIRFVLIGTCGGVSFAHGSNDGQKGMGLLLLVLIGFVPIHYALDTESPEEAKDVFVASKDVRSAYVKADRELPPDLKLQLDVIDRDLAGKESFEELPATTDVRWKVRTAIFKAEQSAADPKLPAELKADLAGPRKKLKGAIEFVPLWVKIGTALALGIGTTIGYKRIVITVAEKIGKTHLTYAQGAAAESVAACTILLAAFTGVPVSTTQVLSSGIAGTMVANRSGVQGATARKILMAWLFTLPCTMLLSGLLFTIGRTIVE